MLRTPLRQATMDRMARAVNAFEQASPETRMVIVAELLSTSAFVVHMTQNVADDKAMNVVLATLEAKLQKGGGIPQ